MTDKALTLYDWQAADVAKMTASISPEVGALVVSAPGAGKTLVTVETLKNLKPEVTLILAPPSTHRSAWARTLRRQGVADDVKPLDGTAKGKRNWEDLKWGKPGYYITSAQWFTRQEWKIITVDAMVVDEIHMLGKYGNAGQKKLVGSRARPGMTAPIRIALSGTPFRNNFENAWTVARWVEPSAISAEYWIWRATECLGKYDHFAPQNIKVIGEKVPGKLASSLTCYIAHYQRTKCCDFHPDGFLAGLAEPIRIERDLKMTTDQAKFYSSMEKTYLGFLTTPDENGKLPVIAEFPITARGMLRFCALGLPSYNPETETLYFEEDCPSPKLDQLIEDIGNLDGKRVLVFTHSKQFADVAAKRLVKAGFSAIAWTGDLTRTRRNKALDLFISGELDVIVGVISAMGTGTDGLQEAAYNVGWLSVDDDASNNIQGIGRLDRLGQTHQVTMIEYRMEKTFDVGHLDKQIQAQIALNRSLVRT